MEDIYLSSFPTLTYNKMEEETKYWKQQYDLMYLIWICTSLVVFGLAMNFVVIVDNGGRMPVANTTIPWESVHSHFDFSNPSTIQYPYFADIYRVGGYVFSLGDFILLLGLIGLGILFILKYHKTRVFKVFTKEA